VAATPDILLKGAAMSQTCSRLFVHVVWATYLRGATLDATIESRVHGCIRAEAERLGCSVIAIGGVENHVHLLLRMPTRVSIAVIVKQAKGVSARFVNAETHPDEHFAWQSGYGAFTVSPWDVERVRGYIAAQREHHSSGKTRPLLEDCGDAEAAAV
jgi:putative transposase